jgi:transposase
MRCQRMNTTKRYSNEFKQEAVRLLESSGMGVQQLCEELGVSDNSLYKWQKLYGKKDSSEDRYTPEDHDELMRLRKELKRVTEERDILKKAVGIFTKELP